MRSPGLTCELVLLRLGRGIDFLGEDAGVVAGLGGLELDGLAVVDGHLDLELVGLGGAVHVEVGDFDDEALAGIHRAHVLALLVTPGRSAT